MQKLDSTRYEDFYARWKLWPDVIRAQVVAKHIFGENVDFNVGKIVEPKPTGGRRLIDLPPYCSIPNSTAHIKEKMESLGWKVEFRKLERTSTNRGFAVMTHAEKKLEVNTDAMPEADAIAFCAIIARIAAGEQTFERPLLVNREQVKTQKWRKGADAFTDPIPEDVKLV